MIEGVDKCALLHDAADNSWAAAVTFVATELPAFGKAAWIATPCASSSAYLSSSGLFEPRRPSPRIMATVPSALSSHERTRVEDYLNDKIQVSGDFESLDSLLSSLRAQHDLQRKQVRTTTSFSFESKGGPIFQATSC